MNWIKRIFTRERPYLDLRPMSRKYLKRHALELGIEMKWYDRKKTIRAECLSVTKGIIQLKKFTENLTKENYLHSCTEVGLDHLQKTITRPGLNLDTNKKELKKRALGRITGSG